MWVSLPAKSVLHLRWFRTKGLVFWRLCSFEQLIKNLYVGELDLASDKSSLSRTSERGSPNPEVHWGPGQSRPTHTRTWPVFSYSGFRLRKSPANKYCLIFVKPRTLQYLEITLCSCSLCAKPSKLVSKNVCELPGLRIERTPPILVVFGSTRETARFLDPDLVTKRCKVTILASVFYTTANFVRL